MAMVTPEPTAAPPTQPDGLEERAARAEQLALELEAARAEIRELKSTLERRVDERTRELQEVLAELETFAYTVAHDLRAPLRAMHGFSQVLLAEYEDRLDARGRQLLQRIAASGERMDGLIKDLLAYSRLSRADISLSLLDLGALVEDVLDQASRDISAADARVEVRAPLPKVWGHASTLLQALTNLVVNAVKFVRPGVPVEVVIRAELRGPVVRIWVEDNGIGIAPDHAQRLFKLFERLHSSSEYPGTGIGLAMVRRALERMGGQAGFDSELGKGSRFWVELPRGPPPWEGASLFPRGGNST